MNSIRRHHQDRTLLTGSPAATVEYGAGDQGLGEQVVAAVLSTPFLAVALAVLTWPIFSIEPTVGPDPSWGAGLYMALEGGLQFGREIVFTYGPLGFLHVPVLYGEGLWMVAIVYQLLVQFGLALSLLWVARRALPLPLALAACFVLLVVGSIGAGVVLIAFVWSFVLVAEDPPDFAAPLLAFGGGALAAVELLAKANYGVAVTALCLVALAAHPGRRVNLARFSAVFVPVLLGLWLLGAQDPANLPAFAHHTVQVISGYSQAMGMNLGTVPWQLPLALAAIAIVLAGVAVATRDAPLGSRLGSCALVGLFVFLSFKQDFVRQSPGARLEFFLLVMGAGLAIASRLPAQMPRGKALAWAGALLAPLLALVIWALPTPSFWSSLAPGDHVSYLREDVAALLSPSQRQQIRAEGTASMRGAYRLPAAFQRRIGARPVAVDPWEIGVAWAYGLNWHPLPVIQDYGAYSPALDRLNAAALAGSDGPRLILRQSTADAGSASFRSVDDRYPAWDAPAAKLAMLCNYRATATAAQWQLVEKDAAHCEPARPIGSVRTTTGASIAIPPAPGPGEVVFARVHGLAIAGWESALSLLYRPRNRSVSFDGGREWRLTPATATDGLILSAPRRVDFPRPFQLAPDARSFSVAVEGAGSRPVEVDFLAQEVER